MKPQQRVSLGNATGPQWEFWNSAARYRFFVGGVGSGKTFAGAVEVLRQPSGTRGMIIAPNFRMLRDSTLDTIHRVMKPFIAEFQRGSMVVRLTNGTELLLRSAENPETLRGPNLGWFWIDEAAQVAPDVWLIALGRLRENPGRGWITTTPKGRNWVYDVVESQSGNADYALIKASTRSNPYVPPGFLESIQQSYTSDFARQEIDGEFLEGGGAIFSRDWFRLVTEVPSGIRWFRYWDLAVSTKTTADYTACAAVGIDAEGNVYVRDMIRGRHEWPDAKRIMIDCMRAEGRGTSHFIESALHGQAAFQDLRRDPSLTQYGIRSYTPDTDKVTRALTWAARAEQGKVRLLRGTWVPDFLDEVARFPNGRHDDQVDTISGGVILASRSWGFRGVR